MYLPDALAERVRAADLPVSRICQIALSTALGNVAQAVVEGDLGGLPEALGLELQLNNYAVEFIKVAYESARLRGSQWVESGDILQGLISQADSLIIRVLDRAGFSAELIQSRLDEEHGPPAESPAESVTIGPSALRVLQAAQEDAQRTGSPIIHGINIAVGLLADSEDTAARVLTSLGAQRILDPVVLDVLNESFTYSRAVSPTAPDAWTTSALLDLAARLERIEKLLEP